MFFRILSGCAFLALIIWQIWKRYNKNIAYVKIPLLYWAGAFFILLLSLLSPLTELWYIDLFFCLMVLIPYTAAIMYIKIKSDGIIYRQQYKKTVFIPYDKILSYAWDQNKNLLMFEIKDKILTIHFVDSRLEAKLIHSEYIVNAIKQKNIPHITIFEMRNKEDRREQEFLSTEEGKQQRRNRNAKVNRILLCSFFIIAMCFGLWITFISLNYPHYSNVMLAETTGILKSVVPDKDETIFYLEKDPAKYYISSIVTTSYIKSAISNSVGMPLELHYVKSVGSDRFRHPAAIKINDVWILTVSQTNEAYKNNSQFGIKMGIIFVAFCMGCLIYTFIFTNNIKKGKHDKSMLKKNVFD